jgi:hypothetical protein
VRLLPRFLFAACVLSSTALAANPFLSAADDKPVTAKFSGTAWNDEIDAKEHPMSAKVVTTRIAQASWGSIFRITFENIVCRAIPSQTIRPLYYIATEDEIVLLNEEDNEAAAKKLAAEERPPAFEAGDVQGISKGTRHSEDKLTETKITVKGDRCTYEWSHNSGHYAKIVWQKGVGLVEYASNYGAAKEGYHVKREPAGKKR